MVERLHTRALAEIQRRRETVAAGTPGPVSMGYDSEKECYAYVPGWCIAEKMLPADAALIVAAVNAFDPLLTLAETVLERHAPEPGTWSDHACSACSDFEMRIERPYPCTDARAVLAALGINDD